MFLVQTSKNYSEGDSFKQGLFCLGNPYWDKFQEYPNYSAAKQSLYTNKIILPDSKRWNLITGHSNTIQCTFKIRVKKELEISAFYLNGRQHIIYHKYALNRKYHTLLLKLYILTGLSRPYRFWSKSCI